MVDKPTSHGDIDLDHPQNAAWIGRTRDPAPRDLDDLDMDELLQFADEPLPDIGGLLGRDAYAPELNPTRFERLGL
jgi:hypothetical protein